MASESKPGMAVDGGGGPVVDPTKNVLDLVEAGMGRQDDMRGANTTLFMALIQGLEKYIDAKFEGRENLTRSKFETVEREFRVLEAHRVEQKTDTKVSIDAAMSASSEQFKQQRETTSAQLGSVESSIADLKERVGKLETQQQTKSETRVDSRAHTGLLVAIGGLALTFLLLAVPMIVAVLRGAE